MRKWLLTISAYRVASVNHGSAQPGTKEVRKSCACF
jgi:hypothetical protein